MHLVTIHSLVQHKFAYRKPSRQLKIFHLGCLHQVGPSETRYTAYTRWCPRAFDAWRRFCGTTSCTYKKGAMASEGSSIHVLPAIPFELANLKKIYLRPQAPFPEHVCFPLWRASFILFTRFLLPIWTCSLVAERKHCSSTSLNTNMICVDLSKIEEATLRATK